MLTNATMEANVSFSNHTFIDLNPQSGWFLAYLTVCAVCIVASIALLLAVLRDQTSSLCTRALISNLCISGIILCLVFIPGLNIAGFFPSVWRFESARNAACPIYMGMQICLTSFSFTDAFLAFNRLIAVCFPHHYNTWQSPKVAYTMVAITWLIGVLTVVLTGLGVGGYFARQPDFTCLVVTTSYFGQMLYMFSGMFPYSIIGIFSTIIFITAYVKSRGLKAKSASSLSAKHQLQLLQKRLVIAKAMAVLLVWSLITATPFVVLPMYILRMQEEHYDLWELVRLIPLTEFALSPLVFLVLSSSYRKSLRRICGCDNRTSVQFAGSMFGHLDKTGTPVAGSTVQKATSLHSS